MKLFDGFERHFLDPLLAHCGAFREVDVLRECFEEMQGLLRAFVLREVAGQLGVATQEGVESLALVAGLCDLHHCRREETLNGVGLALGD